MRTGGRKSARPGNSDGVFLRGGTWWIRYCGPRKGKPWGEIRESARTKDRRKAETFRERRLRGVANHEEGLQTFRGPQQEKLLVGELLDALEQYYRREGLKSVREMKNHLSRIRTAFGFDRATRLDKARVDAYIEARQSEGAAPATIDRETELLRRAFTLAVEDGKLASIPRISRVLKRGANARQGFVERGRFDALVRELPSQLLRDVAIWAYATGMRKGEILSITWDGYDRQTQTIRLHARDAKTGDGRAITLATAPELAAVIERRLSERRLDCPLIFHSNGHRVGDFYTSWARALLRAKVTPFTIHDLRRTAIRNMIRAGVKERVAMDISGHKTRATFDRYNITSEKDLEQAFELRAVYEASLSAQVGSSVTVGFQKRPGRGGSHRSSTN